MWRAILCGTILGTALFVIGNQITFGQQPATIKRTDLLKTALPEMEGKDMNVWVADIPPNSATGRHSLQRRDSCMYSKVRLSTKLMESRRRPSRQASHTRRCRARFTTLETRAGRSQRRLSVSNMATKASHSKPMLHERVCALTSRDHRAAVARRLSGV